MVTFREVRAEDLEAKIGAELVLKYSWGEEYPVDPWNEIKVAEYLIGVFDNEKLVGFGSVTKVASPDGVDNGKCWLADAVVVPEYRYRGIYKKLYESRMEFMKDEQEIYTCTDNPIIEKFLTGQGWQKYRETTCESGEECIVFKFTRD